MAAFGIRHQVVTCDVCGMYAHFTCASHDVAKKACPCRTAAVTSKKHAPSSTGNLERMKHHWVKGNIEPNDTCCDCGLLCGSILALSGMHCAWCHRRVHESCFKERNEAAEQRCDLGRYAKLMLASTSIIVTEREAPSTPRKALRRVRTAARSAVSRLRNQSTSRPR